ncbi:MAG TPA: PaaI family thioesterase [Nitriliruptorales bacterium]
MSGEVWREPFQGQYGAIHPLQRPGLERFSTDPSVRPPIHYLTGLLPVEHGHGTSTFQMPATGWLDIGTGTFGGAAPLFVADAPLTGAIITGLPPGWIATTSELSMSFLRAPNVRSGTFTGRATSVHASRRVGAASVQVTDAAGRLVAHGTTRCMIVEVPGVLDVAPHDPAANGVRGRGTGTPPFQRTPTGRVLTPDEFDARSGRDLMEGYVDGTIDPPPVAHLLGGRPTAVDGDSVAWTFPNTEWLCSPAPFLYGGAIAGMAETALASAYTLAMEAGQICAPMDIKVQFLRPVYPNTGDLAGHAEIVHAGRNVIVARGELHDGAGKLVALATGSALRVLAGVRRLLGDDPDALLVE